MKTKIRIDSRTKKKPTYRHRTQRDYDFLTYIRVVFKWAMVNNNLFRPDLELLLYLYPRGVFNQNTFNKYHRTIGMYSVKTLDRYIEGEWVYVWRHKQGREAKLYALTNKAKALCDKMHKMLVGEIDIPVTRNNRLSVKKDGRMNGYYMELIKEMNKDRRNNEEGE